LSGDAIKRINSGINATITPPTNHNDFALSRRASQNRNTMRAGAVRKLAEAAAAANKPVKNKPDLVLLRDKLRAAQRQRRENPKGRPVVANTST
jgi:hypothetical protein